MVEDKKQEYEVEREGTERDMVIKWADLTIYPSIEGDPITMERVINYLIEAGSMTSITFSAEKNYIYPYNQTKLLNEIARLFVYLVKDKKVLAVKTLMEPECKKCVPEWYNNIRKIVDLIKGDVISAYLTAVRTSRIAKSDLKVAEPECVKYMTEYSKLLDDIVTRMEGLRIIKLVKDKLPGYKIGDREIYSTIFEPIIKPSFMYTRLVSEPPLQAEVVDAYSIKDSNVTIYELKDKIRPFYHLMPPEYKLDEHEYSLLDEAREIMVKFKPRKEEFIDPARMREVFFNISRDLVEEIARNKGLKLSYSRINKIAKILVRLTVGFGLIELLLSDENVEDVYLNAPIGSVPVLIKHAIHGECETNVFPNIKDGNAWASRFRMISGRALDESNPVLDTELTIPGVGARVAIIQKPLSSNGLAFAFRRRRERPWTMPLFIKAKMINPLAAGLLWFLVDGARPMLIAGTRGSGKSSFLASLLIDIMRRFRIISIEDTLELPMDYLRNIGFDALSLKVRSAIVGGKAELSAEEGIRTSLRLGDSCLIVGEVRSKEAISLYEAMRIGALANVVAGTIHGESPYGIFDRLVNDLGVPVTSFKATDAIIVCNKLRDPSGLREVRRVTEITEVGKDWEHDPMREHAFTTLMKYDTAKDELVPTKSLVEGESEIIKGVAGRVREWAGKWDLVWDNILLRANIKKMLIDYSEKLQSPEMLESDFVVIANDQFHKIFDELITETGYPESKDVLKEFERWLEANSLRILKVISRA